MAARSLRKLEFFSCPPTPMPKPTQSDRVLLIAVTVSLLAVAVGFAAAWFFMQHKTRMDAEVRFLTLERVAISRDGHSMAATVAIRTSGSDAGWAEKQQGALQEVVKVALMEADPVQALGPDGLPALQEKIRSASNRMLKTGKIKEVLVTDFLVSEGG